MTNKELIEALQLRVDVKKAIVGEDPRCIFRLALNRINELEEYEFMYKGLSDEDEYDK
jgi:hypothetical protein